MGNNNERRVHVCGLGGIGFWLAVGLSRSDVQNVHGYDDDDLSNGLGHQRLPLATPSTRKTDLLRGFLRVSIGGSVPELHGEKFTGREVRRGDLVIDCSDMSGTARRRIWDTARRRGARCVRVSYDGARSTVVVAEGLPLTNDENASGYANIPSLALSLAAGGIAAEIVSKANWDIQEHIEFQISLGDYLTPRAVQAA